MELSELKVEEESNMEAKELSVEGVVKRYRKKVALSGVTFSMGQGVYGLVGENGAGKSTLMRILTTTDFPTDGKVAYGGRDIVEMGEEYRDLLGYMPQDYSVYSGFSGVDFLEYMGALKGIGKARLKEKIPQVLELVNLTNDARRKIKNYSGGMKRRIGIAQAILNDPDILILDEPTAGLDPSERLRFSNIISNLSNDKIILLSTHIISDIEAIANEVIVLNKGEILVSGNVDDLIENCRGKVWEVVLTQEEYRRSQGDLQVVHIKLLDGQVRVRYVGERHPAGDSVEQEPSLEDFYVSVGGRK